MIRALSTTPVVAMAIFPEVPVDHNPDGIKVKHPVAGIAGGGVMVLIVVVPDTTVCIPKGAMVAAEAMVAPSKRGPVVQEAYCPLTQSNKLPVVITTIGT